MDVLGIFTHLRGEVGQWSDWERDELLRLKAACADVLQNQIWEDGVTDRGDPWIVAIDESSLELSLHVARLDGDYVAVGGDLSPVSIGANLKTVVSDCLAHIRTNRQETVFCDGSTLRMPMGVSVAVFGILLTEHMNERDNRSDIEKSNLIVGQLEPDPIDEFVFLENLSDGQKAVHDDEVIALAADDRLEQNLDPRSVSLLEDEGGAPRDKSGPDNAEPKGEMAEDADVANPADQLPVTAATHVLSKSDNAPSAESAPPPSDAGAAEGQPAAQDGGGEVMVVAPVQALVSEDDVSEETTPTGPKDGQDVTVVDANDQNADAISFAMTKSLGSGFLDDSDHAVDSAIPGSPLSAPSPAPEHRDDLVQTVDLWPTADPLQDIFQI